MSAISRAEGPTGYCSCQSVLRKRSSRRKRECLVESSANVFAKGGDGGESSHGSPSAVGIGWLRVVNTPPPSHRLYTTGVVPQLDLAPVKRAYSTPGHELIPVGSLGRARLRISMDRRELPAGGSARTCVVSPPVRPKSEMMATLFFYTLLRPRKGWRLGLCAMGAILALTPYKVKK